MKHLLFPVLLVVAAFNFSSCGDTKPADEQAVVDTTAEIPVTTISAEMADQKLKALTPEGHEYVYDAEHHRVELHFHHAKQITDKVGALKKHFSTGISYANKVFAEFPDVNTVDVVTTTDMMDKKGTPRKEIVVRNSYERERFAAIEWHKLKGQPILQHVAKASSRRGYIHGMFASNEAAYSAYSAMGYTSAYEAASASAAYDAASSDDSSAVSAGRTYKSAKGSGDNEAAAKNPNAGIYDSKVTDQIVYED